MAILDLDTQTSYAVGGFGEGLDHPECIAWGMDGHAYAGGEAGQIYRIDLERGEFTEIANIGSFVGGMAQDGDGNVYACCGGVVSRITPDGTVSAYTRGSDSDPIRTPNYPAFDSSGNLYVSDSGEWKKDNGRILNVRPGGEATVWCSELREFPNGLCLSPDGAFLYVVMSLNPPRIARVAITEDGSAGDVEKVVDLPGTVPDGVAFDTGGNLYISCYRPDIIYRLSPGGELGVLAEDPEGTMMAAPTNIAFGGARRDILLSANLGRWHITRYHVDAVGAPLNYPKLG